MFLLYDFGMGEDAVDTGVPTKEWLELVMAPCKDKHDLFYEAGDGLQLALNMQAQQNDVVLHGWCQTATVTPPDFLHAATREVICHGI